jgi:hypothetical protein
VQWGSLIRPSASGSPRPVRHFRSSSPTERRDGQLPGTAVPCGRRDTPTPADPTALRGAVNSGRWRASHAPLVAQYADASNLMAADWGGGAFTADDVRRKYAALQEHCIAVSRPYSAVIRTYQFSPTLLGDSPAALEAKRTRVPPSVLQFLRISTSASTTFHPFSDKAVGHGASNPARGTCDHGDFPLQFLHAFPSFARRSPPTAPALRIVPQESAGLDVLEFEVSESQPIRRSAAGGCGAAHCRQHALCASADCGQF